MFASRNTVDETFMTFLGVARDAQHYSVEALEVIQPLRERAHLFRAARRVIFRIEGKNDVPLPLEVVERDDGIRMRRRREKAGLDRLLSKQHCFQQV